MDRSSTIELPDLNNSMDERAPARLMMEVTIITAKIVFRQIEAVSTESRECYLLKGRSRTSRSFFVCVKLAPIIIIIIITLYLLSAFLVSGSARAKPTWTQS